jgi:signal transduction histidine kinase
VTDDADDVVSLIVSARDISERKRRERALTALQEATRSFMGASDQETIAERAVETACTVIDLSINGVWLYEDSVLRPVAMTDEATEHLDEMPTYRGDRSLTWQAFKRDEVEVYDDLQEVSGKLNPETPIRSEMILPLGEYGVMNVGSTERAAFDDVDVSLARVLSETVAAALARAEREQALREQRRELERIRERTEYALEKTDSVIYDIDIETGKSEEYGPSESLFGTDGLDMEEFFSRVVDPDDRERLKSLSGEIQRGETDEFNVEFRADPGDGERRWIAADGFTRDSTETGTRHLVGLATDVTERKHHEREIERHNERLEEFARIVSHDLRNPLNTALGRLTLVGDECDSEHIPTIERALERMERIIGETLTLARQGQTVGEKEAVNLRRLAQRCWGTVDAEGATLQFESELAIEADQNRLSHVLENLFSNAIDHGDEDPVVRVGPLPDRAGFYVEDDGPGIPADDRDDVFEIGYTSDDGTGFGLSIVEEIVVAHGWDIEVTEGHDGGARFEITGVECIDR